MKWCWVQEQIYEGSAESVILSNGATLWHALGKGFNDHFFAPYCVVCEYIGYFWVIREDHTCLQLKSLTRI